MLTTLFTVVVALLPIAFVVALLEVATSRERRRQAAIARQIALTDAIAGEFGAIVAPLVKKPLFGPWQVQIAVPFARPATVGAMLSIAHRIFSLADRTCPGRYRIVLTPQEEAPGRRRGSESLIFRRARAA